MIKISPPPHADIIGVTGLKHVPVLILKNEIPPRPTGRANHYSSGGKLLPSPRTPVRSIESNQRGTFPIGPIPSD